MFRRLLFFNFRLAYGLSQWLRHRFTPAGLLLFGGLVASGIFGANTRQTLAYQICSLLAAALLLSVVSSLRFRRRLHAVRQLPKFATVGQPLQYQVTVANQGGAVEAGLSLIDQLESAFPAFDEFRRAADPQDRRRNWFDRVVGYPRLLGLIQRRRGASIPPIDLPGIPPRDEVRVDLSLVPLRRGYLRFTDLTIARPDPLGLFRAVQEHRDDAALLVLPRLYRVPRVRLDGRRRYQRGGMSLASTVGDSQEFLALREYRPGDPMRAIHWRSFARLGKPVVKEFQDEFFVRHGLVLDTFADHNSSARFEEAVSVAASFALSIPDQDSLLDLMFVGNRAYRFTAGRGLAQSENMLEILACVQPCADQPFSTLTRLVLGHLHEMSGFICVFLDWDAPRRDLVSGLRAAGVPVLALVITTPGNPLDASAGALADQPQRLVGLPAGSIQPALDRLAAAPGSVH
jgi:uncharacterized protein (DUF58 family)